MHGLIIGRSGRVACAAWGLCMAVWTGCSSDEVAPDAGSGWVDTSTWPTQCNLSAVRVPDGADALTAACARLFHAYAVRTRICERPWPLLPEPEFMGSCVALARASGSVLKPADIDDCASTTCFLQCDDPGAACLGARLDLLFPNHDHKGALPPGSPCAAGLQCDSGYCSARSSCGVCQRVLAVGDACDGRPGEPPGTNWCLGAQCTGGVCVLPGKPDGTECQWYYGAEGCQHRCLQPDRGHGTVGHCAPLGVAGEWCGGANNSPECAPGFTCLGFACVPLLPDGAACNPKTDRCQHACIHGACARQRYGLAVGEDCTVGQCLPELRCVDGLCAPYQLPDLGGADLARPVLAKGAECQSSDLCPQGQFCTWVVCPDMTCVPSLRCVDIPPLGGPCGPLDACGPDAVCYRPDLQQPRTCQRLGGVGDSCPCRPEAICHAGRCTHYGPGVCGE